MIELLISNGNKIYNPNVEEGIKWTTERRNSPGKLDCTLINDEKLEMSKGNAVRLKKDGQNIFFGFLWSRKENKEESMPIIAYDQLRYFKYKDTYIYKAKKASELLKLISGERGLETGLIEDTGYVIENRIRDNETVFDVMQDALDLTFDNTGQIYVLYDNFGKIELKNLASMRLNLIYGQDTAEDFDFNSSLDGVYNQVKLGYDNKETGKRETYITKDSENINKWGLLQYYDKIDEKTNGQAKADALLNSYNKLNKTLKLKNALGDIRVRGGTSILIYLPKIGIKNYMLVEKAVHTFKENSHTMDLWLNGRL